MAVRNQILGTVGVLCALWMGVGRWAFGLGGDLTWWYLPLIAVPFAWLQLWVVRRLRIATARGRRVGRAPIVALALSWVSAVGFGLTVPDRVNGELASIVAPSGGGVALEMSIALCNPFGILAFTLTIIALGYAAAAGREPRPEEDEEPVPMPAHPLDPRA